MISPTGFNNIMLDVEFEGGWRKPPPPEIEGDSKESDSNLEIDALFDWLEKYYPKYLPSHQESFYSQGDRVRHYPSNNVYIGVKNGRVYFYDASAKD